MSNRSNSYTQTRNGERNGWNGGTDPANGKVAREITLEEWGGGDEQSLCAGYVV